MESRRNGPQLSSRHDDDDDGMTFQRHAAECRYTFKIVHAQEVGLLHNYDK